MSLNTLNIIAYFVSWRPESDVSAFFPQHLRDPAAAVVGAGECRLPPVQKIRSISQSSKIKNFYLHVVYSSSSPDQHGLGPYHRGGRVGLASRRVERRAEGPTGEDVGEAAEAEVNIDLEYNSNP